MFPCMLPRSLEHRPHRPGWDAWGQELAPMAHRVDDRNVLLPPFERFYSLDEDLDHEMTYRDPHTSSSRRTRASEREDKAPREFPQR